MNNRIIVISYIFPPSARAGAHRAYSMARNLPALGWEPVFIAPERGYYGRVTREDHSLMAQISRFALYRVPFYYPFNDSRSGLVPRAARRLWEELMVPDGQVFWSRAVRKSLKEIISRHSPRAVFITGNPFSSFLLAPYLKEEFGLPVVLDYRDPWADNMLLEPGRLRAAISHRLELKSLAGAALVTTASFHMIDYIRSSHAGRLGEIDFLGFPYGYEKEFFAREILPISRDDKESIIMTFGGFPDGDVGAESILRGVQGVIKDRSLQSRLKVVCYGSLFGKIGDQAAALIARYNLGDNVELRPFLPYDQFLVALRKSSALLLPHGTTPINRVTYPSKFFDYLGVKRPVLYIGGDGQVPETILECQAGYSARPEPDKIEQALRELCEKARGYEWYQGTEAYERLERTRIFAEFVRRLESKIGDAPPDGVESRP